MASPRQYEVQPRRLLFAVGLITLTSTLLVFGIFFFTPVRGLFAGTNLENYREVAEMNSRRAAAFEDSVAI